MNRRLTLALLLLATALPGRAQDEVPFITTPDNVTLAMLGIAAVGPGDHVVDLGSGDGRIVITAARRFGASGLGVEIVPDLVRQSRANARAAGVEPRARFVEQDLFATNLHGATVVTLYLLPAVNLQLRPRLLALPPGTRVVSHDWDMGDWRPDRSQRLEVPDKVVGREKASTVHLWVVPAQVQGLWCGPAGTRLEVAQRFQAFSATLWPREGATPAAVLDGRVAGTELNAEGPYPAALRAEGARLRVLHAATTGPNLAGQVFERAEGGRCAGR